MKDPAVRKDGKCACGCGKLLPVRTLKPKDLRAARRYSGQSLDSDPFATSGCARKWHGCQLAGDEDLAFAELKSEFGRRGKAAGPLSRGTREPLGVPA